MLQRIGIAASVILLMAVAVVGFFVFRTPEEASQPIEAIPLAVATTTPVEEVPTNTPEPEPTATDTLTPSKSEGTPTETPEPEPTATSEPSPTLVPTDPILFELIQDESEARFLIDEVLRGADVTVVGVSNQVAGQIAVNPANLAQTQVGVMRVNARTLVTDNDFRNRAIKNAILFTDNYEFITFTPSNIVGLPKSGTVGESYTFQIEGDLTITDVTQPVTFEVVLTPVSEIRLEGLASTEVLYRDFGLVIPDSPAVDTVEDNVRIELEFVAVAVQ